MGMLLETRSGLHSDDRTEYPLCIADTKAICVIGQVIWYARQLIRED